MTRLVTRFRIRTTALLLAAVFVLSGCVNESEPDLTREDSVLDFYMPRSTETQYLYKYSGFFSGKRDSTYNVTYVGVDQSLKSVDSMSPIHRISVKATDREVINDVEFFVTDTMIVEYGPNASSASERFVVLHGKLKAGTGWKAAFNYEATPEIRVSYLARVIEYFPQMEVKGIVYKDVWQVNYEVTGAPIDNNKLPQEYLNKARRVIYFAKGVGKILEIAYSPDNREQWKTELQGISRR